MIAYDSQGDKIRRFFNSVTPEEMVGKRVQVSGEDGIWKEVDNVRLIDNITNEVYTSIYYTAPSTTAME